MKLRSCQVENFGNLSEKTYFFEDGLNAFCEENGAGKTTLAAFLKVMFYGMDGYRVNATAFSERQRYYPFSGGKFGGNVVFEDDGDIYKIERFFDVKSETKDTLKVYKNNVETDIEDPGAKFFGVDKNSFERTAFISSDEVAVSATSDIRKKLNCAAEGLSDEGSFDNAIKLLEKQEKTYQKTRGENSKIAQTKNKATFLQTKIDDLKKTEKALPLKFEELAESERRIEALNERMKRAAETDKLRERAEHQKELDEKVADSKRKIEEIEKKYPLGLPQKTEIETLRRAFEELRIQEERFESAHFPREKEKRLCDLKTVFQRGVPSQNEFLSAKEDEAELQKLLVLKNNTKSRERSVEENKILSRFDRYLPPLEEVEEAERNLHAVFEAKKDAGKEQSKKRAGRLFSAVFFAVLLIAGALLFSKSRTVSAALFAIGILGEASTAISGTKRRAHTQQTQKASENAVRSKLAEWGYFGENVEVEFIALKNDRERYAGLKREETEYVERLRELEEKERAARAKLNAFFVPFKENGVFIESVYEAEIMAKEYAELSKEERVSRLSRESAGEKLQEINTRIDAFCARYAFDADGLEERLSFLSDDVSKLTVFRQSLAENEQSAEKNRAEKGADFFENDADETYETLSELFKEENARQSDLKNEISLYENDVEGLGDLENELEERQTELETYQKRHRLLSGAKKLLCLAEDRLIAKYVDPIKTEFVKYANVLENALGEKLVMGRNFEIRFERGGEERSEKHLSSGQRMLCWFCFRLALLENMYADKQPFLVLDDPFVELDEKHLQRAKSLLLSLCGDRQILYFTCHESRLPKEKNF